MLTGYIVLVTLNMMNHQKLLVLSDTHENVSALLAVLGWARGGEFDTVVFLGDGIADIEYARRKAGFSCAWLAVKGNNDWGSRIPEAGVFEAGGHRFLFCHGHHYGLYGGYDTLIAAARNMEADAALFGHTHVPVLEQVNGVLLVNPGSIGRPRSSAGATFAVIECVPEQPLDVQFWRIGSRGTIQKWKNEKKMP